MSMVVGTEDGVGLIEKTRDSRFLGLGGAAVNHVAARDGTILAAVAHDGLYRVDERGAQLLWRGDARSCAIDAQGTLFVGAEPAMVFRSRDGGESWDRLSAIDELPTRKDWYFPPPPHEPHVLSIDTLPDRPHALVAGVEVGGALYSEDGGDSWEERNEGLYVDVHSLRPDRAAGVLFAVTGRGFYASDDGGAHWERRMDGIDNGYTIGLACNPQRGGEVFVAAGVSPPGVNARLYRSTDAGRSWTELPEPPTGLQGRAPVPFFAGGAPHIGTASGSVLRLDERHGKWVELCHFPTAVTCVCAEGVPSSVMH